jgi:hypothetical protein
LHGIVNVRTLLDAQRIDGSGDELRVDRYADLIAAHRSARTSCSPIARRSAKPGLFVSPPATITRWCWSSTPKPTCPPGDSADHRPGDGRAADGGLRTRTMHIAAFPAAVAEMIEETHFNVSGCTRCVAVAADRRVADVPRVCRWR